MLRNVMIAALGSAAIAVAGPVIAAPGGGGGGPGANANVNAGTHDPSATAIDSRVNSMGPANASPMGVTHSNPNSVLHTNPTTTPTARATKSQSLQHASPTGIAHANSKSALARGAVAPTALPGLTTGLTVNNSAGTSIGTVSRVVAGTDGSIRLVIVTSPTGRTYRLAPTSLNISGGVVTTSSM
ncbi:MAG: hypothetical protein V4502_03040 [Pseudomonadota bacterium]